jgi:hypothetical protein
VPIRCNPTPRIAVATLALLALSSQSDAQQTVRVLTPTDDICGVYVTAILTQDQIKILSLGGWYLGFLSGAAEGTNVDFYAVRRLVP